jgi:predicted O-methyltransferase YrrM
MCEGLALTAHLSTVELEVTQAAAMRHLLHDRSNVEVLAGDWWQLERKVPFDLLFVDARPPKYGLADDLLTESL